jgi:hypothetical protein
MMTIIPSNYSGERDRAIGFHWHAPDLGHELGLPPARNTAFAATRASVLAEAILGFECGQSVSYSRNKNFYANSQRYRGTSYSYRSMLGTIAEIGDAGLILDCRVPQGNLGWQSSFQATGRLIEVWLATRQRLEYIQSEIIELKNNAGALIDYPETALTYRMRSELAERNEALAAVQISVPDAERHGRHLLPFWKGPVLCPSNPRQWASQEIQSRQLWLSWPGLRLVSVHSALGKVYHDP